MKIPLLHVDKGTKKNLNGKEKGRVFPPNWHKAFFIEKMLQPPLRSSSQSILLQRISHTQDI
jgi:hypothetical protein